MPPAVVFSLISDDYFFAFSDCQFCLVLAGEVVEYSAAHFQRLKKLLEKKKWQDREKDPRRTDLSIENEMLESIWLELCFSNEESQIAQRCDCPGRCFFFYDAIPEILPDLVSFFSKVPIWMTKRIDGNKTGLHENTANFPTFVNFAKRIFSKKKATGTENLKISYYTLLVKIILEK